MKETRYLGSFIPSPESEEVNLHTDSLTRVKNWLSSWLEAFPSPSYAAIEDSTELKPIFEESND